MENFYKLYDKGEMAYNMIRYIPGLAKIAYRGQLGGTEAKRKYADDTYKEKKLLKLINFQNVQLCFPLKFKSKANNDDDFVAGTITVNIFFTH